MRTLLGLCMLLMACATNAQPFTKTLVCSGIRYGVAFDVAPDGRFFVTEKGVEGSAPSQIKVFDGSGNFVSVFYDLSDSVFVRAESGLLGITLDPDFASNHFVYVYFTYADTQSIFLVNEHIIIQRFTEVNNTGTQPVQIFDYPLDSLNAVAYYSNIHVGGNIHFRPSDSTHIYVTIGDLGTGESGLDHAAFLDNPIGKMLRISKYPHAFPPADNPFYDDGNPYTGNCDWIWSYGHRNAFDFCFGPNDSLYASENGRQRYDEVNLITRGGFYGWPLCEGPENADSISIPCNAANAIAPLMSFPNVMGLPALTGIIFYTDTAWSIQQNRLITADINRADLTQIYLSNAPAYTVGDTAFAWIDASQSNGLSDLWQGRDGCLYVLEFADSASGGGIYKICPVAAHVAEPAAIPSLSAAPNPFHESSTITYSLSQSTTVNIAVFDITGRLHSELTDTFQYPGTHTLEIDAQKLMLAPGVYICVLRSGLGTSSVRLIVQ